MRLVHAGREDDVEHLVASLEPQQPKDCDEGQLVEVRDLNYARVGRRRRRAVVSPAARAPCTRTSTPCPVSRARGQERRRLQGRDAAGRSVGTVGTIWAFWACCTARRRSCGRCISCISCIS